MRDPSSRARLAVAAALLAVLIVTTGCLSVLGGGTVGDDQLNEAPDEPYDWSTGADATVDIRKETYHAVYDVPGRELPVYVETLTGESPLEVSALRYRYPNGTVLEPADAEAFNVSESRDRLTVHLPAAGGKLGFTAPAQGTSVGFPVYYEDPEEPPSYEVILPPETDVAVPLLSNVRPGGYTARDVDGRVHVEWDEMTASGVSVRFYLDRDLYVFGGLLAIGTVLGLIGAGYYLLQIRRLVRRREEVGLDVDVEDDSRDPPPGMG